ncbi:glycosyltransferase family 2 protein [Streptococcus equinus]|uniref:glycosyltransferase family 2 protein n=1 Tax=Streptococcus equinus TaxID=1335 RepID=UPI0004097459|nr:glycosyltransferase [Streptococcus equinus]
MQKLVSIILPVYNVENYIKKCLKSIRQQSYSNFEVIIVNDGSSDNSIKYCEEICEMDSRFFIINKENGGLSDARNVGISLAKGEYLIFIDSDDFISESMVQHLVSCIEKFKSDLAICNPVHYYWEKRYEVEGSKIFSSVSDAKITNFTSTDALCELFYQKSFLVSAWGKIYKKELFKDIRFPKGKLFEDSAIMYLLFEKCKKITYSDAKLYAYVHRDESITTKNFSRRDLDILEITNQIENRYKNDVKLNRAAISYKVSACFRILLNAPNTVEYKTYINECKNYIYKNWKNIMFDRNVRLKNKLALISISLFKPFVKFIYSRVNRWE